ncbi:hypothetical protein BJY00DRAFT_302507 [Aspergillus carlsbadensis]|nr:hypothetical protein BJY00DRAFT_302507 [Aspergillus carlsbadensis]
MITSRKLSDLVADSRLVVGMHGTRADYFNIAPQTSSEGRAGGSAPATKKGQLQVVKVVPNQIDFDVYAELEAIAKFSQSSPKYEGLFVKSLGWYEDENLLSSHLTRPLPEDEARQITIQVLEGIACLHANEFNILVASKCPRWWVKIGDFGFSKRTSGDTSLHSFVGTRKYLAPEVLGLHPHWAVATTTNSSNNGEGGGYRCTYPMDMWSLGITAFYMFCHDYPFHDRELVAYLAVPFPLTSLTDRTISEDACAFIKALMTVDPSKRLTAAEGLKHPLLAEEPFMEDPSQAPERLQSMPRTRMSALFPSVTNASVSWPISSTTWTSDVQLRNEVAPIPRGVVPEPKNVAPPNTGVNPHNNGDEEEDGSRAKAVEEFSALHKRGFQLLAEKKYTQAEALFQQAVDGRKHLGVSYFLQDRHQDAQRTLQLTADIQAESLSSTHTNTLTSNYWLGSSLLAQGKLDAAQEVVDRALEIQKMVLGVDNEDTVKSLWLAGQIYYQQGKYDHALLLFDQAADAAATIGVDTTIGAELLYPQARSILEEMVQTSPTEDADAAQARNLLSNIGEQLFQQEKYADAESCFEKVEARKKALGPTHEQTLHSSVQLASSLRKQREKAARAQEVLREVLDLSPPRITSQGELDHEREYPAAYGVFKEVLARRTAVMGGQHPDTLRSASWLGRSMLKEKRYAEATALFTTLRRDQRGTLGHDHLDSLHYQGQTRDGFPYISAAPRIFRRTLGTDHRDTVLCLRYLGSAHGQLKEYTPAENTLRPALDLAKRVRLAMALYGTKGSLTALEYLLPAADAQIAALGETHEDTLDTLFCIAAALDALKRYAEGEEYRRRVADTRLRLLGMNHAETQTATRALATCLSHQGRWEEAARLHEKVLKAREETLGTRHQETNESKKDLKKCTKAQAGKWVIFWPEHRQLQYRHL